ncbi:GTPase [Staphylococcus equorum]|uniref:GTPase n=1 Tax=Staphylococcus equorum TaxID=246432 RepID=UPI003EB8B3CC
MINISEYDKYLKINFNKTLTSLKKISSITSVNIKDENIKKSLKDMNDSIYRSILLVNKQITNLEKNMAWNNLNIAFFGETNAGKSTIIEALLQGEGLSIGDGTKDFTKKLTQKKYGDVDLLDLPGMEGNEEEYIEEIKKGINKAHYVFYVSNNSKEPEEKTLAKIKSYLKDQTNIYSIINIRRPLNKNTKENLVNENIKTVINRTDEKFQTIFGNNYKGNIYLNAKLGYLLRTNNKNKDILMSKEKLINLLDSEEKVYEYSNFKRLVQLINKVNNNKTREKEIAISNTYKFLSLNESIISNILKGKKDLDIQIFEIESNFNNAKDAIKKEIESFKIKIKMSLNVEVLKFQNEMKELFTYENSKKLDKKEIDKELNKVKNKFNKSIEKMLENEFKDLSNRILNNYKQMKEQVILNIKYTNFENSFFNIEDIMKKFSINITQILKNIGSLVITAFSSFAFGPILGGINVVFTASMKVFKWNKVDRVNNQKRRIKDIHSKIEEEVTNIEEDINWKLEDKINDFNKNIERENAKLSLYIKSIKEISFNMTSQIKRVSSIKSEVSKRLLEFVEEENIEFAYIDYKMSSLLYVGKKLKNKKIYNLKYIESYNNIQEFYFHYDQKRKGDFIYLKYYEEFQKRSVSELINHLNYKYKQRKIKGVRRLKNDNN